MSRWPAVPAAALTALLAAAPAVGQEAPAAPRFAQRTNAQWIGAAILLRPASSRINRGNRLLAIPETTWLSELRVDTRIEQGARWQLVVRPRVRGSVEKTQLGSRSSEQRRAADVELTEAYLTWRPTDAVALTYGLQNFQWGPAELMGPSNRLFHEIGVFRDPLYSARGKHLARLNVSAGRQWSFVALAELGATDEAPFRAGAEFRRAGQGKLEYTTPSGAAYFGATVGVRGGEPPWLGGYAAVTITDSLSAYLDAALQRGSQAWYPVSTGDGSTTFATTSRASGSRALALLGLRYTLSAAFDGRIEYLRQEAGYTRSQVAAAPRAIEQRPSASMVERWLSPGLEFLGRDLVLVSVLARDLPPTERLELHGRYVRSLTDGSGALFVTASLDASDAVIVFLSVSLAHGPELAEFTRLARAGGTAGLIWSW